MQTHDKKHVLVAILGMFPAVLTEAVWALAVNKKIVPDKIVVFTTSDGEKVLKEKLFDEGVWERLKKELRTRKLLDGEKLSFDIEKDVKIFKDSNGDPIPDLRTSDDNLRAANMMMKSLVDYTRAENEKWVIHGLVSGGRKTMTALFFSCMCLQGRSGDKMYHVLTKEKYERNMEPEFFFPERRATHDLMKDKKVIETVKSKDIEVTFFEVPFVHMGDWAEKICRVKGESLSYELLIAAVDKEVRGASLPEKVVLDFEKGHVLLDEKRIKTSSPEFAVFIFLLQGYEKNGVLKRMRLLKEKMSELGRVVFEEKKDTGSKWFYKLRWREGYGDEKPEFCHADIRNEVERRHKCAQDYDHKLEGLKKKFSGEDAMLLDYLLHDIEEEEELVFNPSERVKVEKHKDFVPDELLEMFFPPDAKFKIEPS